MCRPERIIVPADTHLNRGPPAASSLLLADPRMDPAADTEHVDVLLCGPGRVLRYNSYHETGEGGDTRVKHGTVNG